MRGSINFLSVKGYIVYSTPEPQTLGDEAADSLLIVYMCDLRL